MRLSGYWGYGSEYQKDDNLDAYKAVVGNGISFIDTSEVCCIIFIVTLPIPKHPFKFCSRPTN